MDMGMLVGHYTALLFALTSLLGTRSVQCMRALVDTE